MKRARMSASVVGLLVTILTFVAGMAAGGAVVWFVRPEARQMILRPDDTSRLLDRLHLTGAQRERARAILDGSAPRTEAILIETSERLRSVADSVDAELRATLTPEQRQLLDRERRSQVFVVRRKGADGREVIDTVRGARPSRVP